MISKERLEDGYKLYIAKDITDIIFLYEYVFNASRGNVEKIVPEVDEIIIEVIEREYNTLEPEKVRDFDEQVEIIDNLYKVEKRDEVINDLLKNDK
jgi:hypothetical protein